MVPYALRIRRRQEQILAEGACMSKPLHVETGQIVALKKGHPCGENRWEVVRVGADIGLKCVGCGRKIMLSRADYERRFKEALL